MYGVVTGELKVDIPGHPSTTLNEGDVVGLYLPLGLSTPIFAGGAVRWIVEKRFVGERNVQEFEPTMGAEDFSFYLLEKPGCYFLIGNGNGEHRLGGHGQGAPSARVGARDREGDHDPAWAEHSLGWNTFDAEQRALRIGAIREAYEEAAAT